MRKIVFISACKTKIAEKGRAKDMYVGDFSKKAYKYATKIQHDAIFFLSPEFCVVEPDQEVFKVDKQFKDMTASEKRDWAKGSISQLIEKGIDVDKDELLFLTPKNYWKWIKEELQKNGKSTVNFKTPLDGLSQGWQKNWITKRLNEVGK